MDPKKFVEWLNQEIEQFIGQATSNGISLDYAQKICSKAHELIETMSVEERSRTNTLLEGGFSKYWNVFDKYLEGTIEGIIATIYGFLR